MIIDKNSFVYNLNNFRIGILSNGEGEDIVEKVC